MCNVSPFKLIITVFCLKSKTTLLVSMYCKNHNHLHFSEAWSITQGIQNSPLPSFSSLVLDNIRGKEAKPERIWSKLVAETADYYLGKWPNIMEAHQYAAIGKKMFSHYPSIALKGNHPWVIV